MWLLTFSTILFIIVVGMIIYANWPSSPKSSFVGCGCGGGGCPNCPCRQCGAQRAQCGCRQKPAGCSFC